MTITGEAELEEADFVAAWRWVPAHARFRSLAFTLLAAWVVVAVTGVLGRRPDASVTEVLPLLLGTAVLPLAFGWIAWRGPRSWADRSMLDLGRGKVQLSFDDAGLEYRSPLRQHRLVWAALPQHIETPASFLVYTGSQSLLLLPKRAFAEPDVVALRELLVNRIPTQATQQRGPSKRLLLWVVLIVAFLSIWHFLRLDAVPPASLPAVPVDGE